MGTAVPTCREIAPVIQGTGDGLITLTSSCIGSVMDWDAVAEFGPTSLLTASRALFLLSSQVIGIILDTVVGTVVVLPLMMDISLICVGCMAGNIVETTFVVKVIGSSPLDCVVLAGVVVLLLSDSCIVCVDIGYAFSASFLVLGIVLGICDVVIFSF